MTLFKPLPKDRIHAWVVENQGHPLIVESHVKDCYEEIRRLTDRIEQCISYCRGRRSNKTTSTHVITILEQ